MHGNLSKSQRLWNVSLSEDSNWPKATRWARLTHYMTLTFLMDSVSLSSIHTLVHVNSSISTLGELSDQDLIVEVMSSRSSTENTNHDDDGVVIEPPSNEKVLHAIGLLSRFSILKYPPYWNSWIIPASAKCEGIFSWSCQRVAKINRRLLQCELVSKQHPVYESLVSPFRSVTVS